MRLKLVDFDGPTLECSRPQVCVRPDVSRFEAPRGQAETGDLQVDRVHRRAACVQHEHGEPLVRRRLDPHLDAGWDAQADCTVVEQPAWVAMPFLIHLYGLGVGDDGPDCL